MPHLNNVALIFLSSMSLTVSFAFAENPTPYNEWDFDITELNVHQNEFDLEKLDITIDVLFKGELPEGTIIKYCRQYSGSWESVQAVASTGESPNDDKK